MKRYKIKYECDGKDNFAVVEARSMVNAREVFLYEHADIDPEIDGISPYTVYDEIQAERLRQITEEGYSTKHEVKDPRSNLIRAAALIVAEIERLKKE